MGSKRRRRILLLKIKNFKTFKLPKDSPGNGEGIFKKNGKKFIVLNLMGNVFMKKCDDVFVEAKKFIETI